MSGRVWPCLVVALSMLLVSCSPDEPVAEPSGDAIRIGSFNFDESELLAEIYAGALEAEGFEIDLVTGLAPREIMQPALRQGHIDFLPEYVGTSLGFSTLGREQVPQDAEDAHDLLKERMLTEGVSVLDYAPAKDANEVVVTSDTAEEYDLKKVSDLAKADSEITFGASPECPQRRTCLRGLDEVYDLEFADFLSLDPGGPLTLAALHGGEIQAGILFSTSPALASGRLVALEDDKDLQPPENVVPMVRTEIVEELGAEVPATIDAVSKRLSTAALRRLNGLVADHGMSPHEVSELWLEEKGLL